MGSIGVRVEVRGWALDSVRCPRQSAGSNSLHCVVVFWPEFLPASLLLAPAARVDRFAVPGRHLSHRPALSRPRSATMGLTRLARRAGR